MSVLRLTEAQRKAVAALVPFAVAHELSEMDPRLQREVARLRAIAENVVRSPAAVISSGDLATLARIAETAAPVNVPASLTVLSSCFARNSEGD